MAMSNGFFVSLRSDDVDTIQPLWSALSEGAVMLQAPVASQWSPKYCMLRDRFGVTWVVDVVLRTCRLHTSRLDAGTARRIKCT